MPDALLIITRQANGPAPVDALYTALATAALDLPVHLLWLGPGLQQMEATAGNDQNGLHKALGQLALFDTIQLFAATQQPTAAGVLSLPVTLLENGRLPAFLGQHRQVLVY